MARGALDQLSRWPHLHVDAAQGGHLLRRRPVHLRGRPVLVRAALRPGGRQRPRLGRQGGRPPAAGARAGSANGHGDAAGSLRARPGAARQRADLSPASARSGARVTHVSRRLGSEGGPGIDGGARSFRLDRARAGPAPHADPKRALLAEGRGRERAAVSRSRGHRGRRHPGRRGAASRGRHHRHPGAGGRAPRRLRGAQASEPAGHDQPDRRRNRGRSERSVVQPGATRRPRRPELPPAAGVSSGDFERGRSRRDCQERVSRGGRPGVRPGHAGQPDVVRTNRPRRIRSIRPAPVPCSPRWAWPIATATVNSKMPQACRCAFRS